MATTTLNYLSNYRTCEFGFSRDYLWVYTNGEATGWLEPDSYTYRDIVADLRERGVSNYDLSIISNHCMVINDGAVMLSARNTDCGYRQKRNCLARIAAALSA